MPELKIVSADKSFSGVKVIDDVSIETSDGELVVVLGPSGCGKSTLLRLIAGLESLDRGEIWIGSKRVDKLQPRKRNVALVFQNYALYPHMTVEENLAFPLKVIRMNRREIKDRVISTAALIGLSDRLLSRPAELSGGQRQRVALGRAIIRKPALFLLDEPLSNLDADLRVRMRRELVKIQRELGTTTVHVTHDQTEALTMADRLIVLENGRIRQAGSVEEVYSRPADTFVASFVGSPKINLVEGYIENNLIKPFNLASFNFREKPSNSGLVLGIRPENIILDEHGPFAGKIESVDFLGDRSIVGISYQGYSLIAASGPKKYRVNDTARFAVETGHVMIFDRESGKSLA
jgi:multiple sugar transport system ATP-binding protein